MHKADLYSLTHPITDIQMSEHTALSSAHHFDFVIYGKIAMDPFLWASFINPLGKLNYTAVSTSDLGS